MRVRKVTKTSTLIVNNASTPKLFTYHENSPTKKKISSKNNLFLNEWNLKRHLYPDTFVSKTSLYILRRKCSFEKRKVDSVYQDTESL